MAPMRGPPPETLRTRLRDGLPVLIRPVTPEDKPLLRKGFTRLSEESGYRRFMRPVKELSEADLDYLTPINMTLPRRAEDLPNSPAGRVFREVARRFRSQRRRGDAVAPCPLTTLPAGGPT